MARDQTRRPVTDAELEGLREEIRDQRSEIREALAEEGVDVSEWSVSSETDGGDEHETDA